MFFIRYHIFKIGMAIAELNWTFAQIKGYGVMTKFPIIYTGIIEPFIYEIQPLI